MSAATPPATTLSDVVVTNEQTRAPWRAGRASIAEGAIVINVTGRVTIPSGIADNPNSTFTIVARDGGGRARRFDGVKVDRDASRLPKKIVFR